MPRQSAAKSLGILALALATPIPGALAGAFCGDPVESGRASGKTEQDAKAAAITWWESRAGSLGKGYETWAAAESKSENCASEPDGSVRCVVSARPCLPDGMLPENVPKLEL